MAADSGNLTGNDIVLIGGSGRRADTALILKSANLRQSVQGSFYTPR